MEENHQSVTKDIPEVVQGEDSQMRDHSVESDQVEESQAQEPEEILSNDDNRNPSHLEKGDHHNQQDPCDGGMKQTELTNIQTCLEPKQGGIVLCT